METVKEAWKRVEPNAEFMGSFLDENINRTLREEKVMTSVITSGAAIAIVLSCVGLFAISLLVVAQRTKEIGIRKVVGAGVGAIIFLLSKDFLKLVIIALFIALPLAWLLMSKWLQGYAYRIPLTAWYFVAAGMLAVLIAFVTISLRTVRAATANPVKSLRTE
jgi:ABC-type antimicrobial peptide transport system permease subunit